MTDGSGKRPDRQASIYHSPLRLLMIIALSVFISEASVMILLSMLPPFSMWVEAFVDSTLLVALLSPMLYFFIFHPLIMHITERRRAEDALNEEKEKYQKLIETASDAIFIADMETGIILDANKKAEELLGLPAGKIIGLNQVQLHPQEEAERYRKIFEDYIKKYSIHGGEAISDDLFVCHISGRRIPVEIRASITEFGNKKIIQGFFRDITERKKTEQIRLENERLVYASKTKSEFLATMSHELRTPLNSIIGFSELLKQKTPGELNEKQEHYVNNVLTGGNNLLRLINDILDLSRVEAGNIELEIEKVSVSAITDESLNLIKEKAGANNIILKRELDPGLNAIEADKQRIKQVLFNLMSNAVKFSKTEGGTVTVTTKKEGDMAYISVSDTGIGIKEEDMGRLFKEFEQLDSGSTRKYGGTGLGLVISKKLVELHGGTITAQSRFGEGTKFTFTLPLPAKKEADKR